ncbi:MAG: hypothetical protein JWN22_552 [Nocardioides sp.]|nr:hypothetical protein [Nocardioides sp.]
MLAELGSGLGGVIAREVARGHPHAVRRVITYGTPVVGGPRFTAAARTYPPGESAGVVDRLDATSPIRVPPTVVFGPAPWAGRRGGEGRVVRGGSSRPRLVEVSRVQSEN